MTREQIEERIYYARLRKIAERNGEKELRRFTADDDIELCGLALRGLEAQWVSVSKRLPTKLGWYGVLDADNEPRAGLFVKGQWAANVAMPIRAWCNFPPLPPAPEEKP